MSFPCVYVEKSFQTAVEIYVNYITQSKLFLGCAAKYINQLQTTLFIRLTYDIAHHGKYVHRILFVVHTAGQYGGNGHAVLKATSRNVVQCNFFYGSTTLVGLGLFTVDVSKSHSRHVTR